MHVRCVRQLRPRSGVVLTVHLQGKRGPFSARRADAAPGTAGGDGRADSVRCQSPLLSPAADAFARSQCGVDCSPFPRRAAVVRRQQLGWHPLHVLACVTSDAAVVLRSHQRALDERAMLKQRCSARIIRSPSACRISLCRLCAPPSVLNRPRRVAFGLFPPRLTRRPPPGGGGARVLDGCVQVPGEAAERTRRRETGQQNGHCVAGIALEAHGAVRDLSGVRAG